MNTKSSSLWLENGSNDLHNESLALSLLEICCSSSSSNLKDFLLKFFGDLEVWSVKLQWFRAYWSVWRLLSLILIKFQVLEERFKGISNKISNLGRKIQRNFFECSTTTKNEGYSWLIAAFKKRGYRSSQIFFFFLKGGPIAAFKKCGYGFSQIIYIF